MEVLRSKVEVGDNIYSATKKLRRETEFSVSDPYDPTDTGRCLWQGDWLEESLNRAGFEDQVDGA